MITAESKHPHEEKKNKLNKSGKRTWKAKNGNNVAPLQAKGVQELVRTVLVSRAVAAPSETVKMAPSRPKSCPLFRPCTPGADWGLPEPPSLWAEGSLYLSGYYLVEGGLLFGLPPRIVKRCFPGSANIR